MLGANFQLSEMHATTQVCTVHIYVPTELEMQSSTEIHINVEPTIAHQHSDLCLAYTQNSHTETADRESFSQSPQY